MPNPGWREDPRSNEIGQPPSWWCSILSTEGHKHCPKPYWCGCPCHLTQSGNPTARWRKKLGVPYDPGKPRMAGVRS